MNATQTPYVIRNESGFCTVTERGMAITPNRNEAYTYTTLRDAFNAIPTWAKRFPALDIERADGTTCDGENL